MLINTFYVSLNVSFGIKMSSNAFTIKIVRIDKFILLRLIKLCTTSINCIVEVASRNYDHHAFKSSKYDTR